jgi:hypothetical protein
MKPSVVASHGSLATLIQVHFTVAINGALASRPDETTRNSSDKSEIELD